MKIILGDMVYYRGRDINGHIFFIDRNGRVRINWDEKHRHPVPDEDYNIAEASEMRDDYFNRGNLRFFKTPAVDETPKVRKNSRRSVHGSSV